MFSSNYVISVQSNYEHAKPTDIRGKTVPGTRVRAGPWGGGPWGGLCADRAGRGGATHFQELQLLHTAVQQLEGALSHLARPLQEEEQGALAGEQVAAQV